MFKRSSCFLIISTILLCVLSSILFDNVEAQSFGVDVNAKCRQLISQYLRHNDVDTRYSGFREVNPEDPTEPKEPHYHKKCHRNYPRFTPKKEGDGGFQVIFGSSQQVYSSRRIYSITLRGPKEKNFRRFQLILETTGHQELHGIPLKHHVGSFVHLSQDPNVLRSEDCPTAIEQSSNISKSIVKVNWEAPPYGSACVAIKAAVIVNSNEWYMDDGRLTLKVCSDGIPSLDEPPEQVQICRACGEAKYLLIFENLWTTYTHPSKLPDKWKTNFTDLIGASHSTHFKLYQEGENASIALRTFAETGNSYFLKSEIKSNIDKIRTVIVAHGVRLSDQWNTTFALFRVTPTHHRISFVSKMAPSPDWFVGVSDFELCLYNGSWITERQFNLNMIDAGIDSALNYTAEKKPTIPAQPIKQKTSSGQFPPGSPFYNEGEDIKLQPFARITVKLLRAYERTCDPLSMAGAVKFDLGTASFASTARCPVTEWKYESCEGTLFQVGFRRRTRELLSPRLIECNSVVLDERVSCIVGCDKDYDDMCSTTEWGPWSSCNTNCGNGIKTRQRQFRHPESNAMCEPSDLIEQISCTSSCSDQSTQDQRCLMTAWEEADNCSRPCGDGIVPMKRKFVNEKAPVYCNQNLTTEFPCNKGPCPPNVEEVCFKPFIVKNCRSNGPKEKFTYSLETLECEKVDYFGCDTDTNIFDSLETCRKLCVIPIQEMRPP